MSRLFSSAYRVPIFAVVSFLVFAGISNVAGSLHAAKTLETVKFEEGVPTDVDVHLDFEPERFHLEQFQNVGRYLGWHDGYAVILNADPDALRSLARKYWVERITAHQEVPA